MAPNLKRRLLGAFVTILVIVITLPVILDKTRHMEVLPSDVPPMPEIPEWAEVQNEQRVRVELTELASGEAEKSLLPQDGQVVEQDDAAIDSIEHNKAGLDQQHNAVAWVLQLGAFKERAKANKLTSLLRNKGYKAFTDEFPTDDLTRVYVGPELIRADAEALQQQLKSDLKQDDVLIKRWQPSR